MERTSVFSVTTTRSENLCRQTAARYSESAERSPLKNRPRSRRYSLSSSPNNKTAGIRSVPMKKSKKRRRFQPFAQKQLAANQTEGPVPHTQKAKPKTRKRAVNVLKQKPSKRASKTVANALQMHLQTGSICLHKITIHNSQITTHRSQITSHKKKSRVTVHADKPRDNLA